MLPGIYQRRIAVGDIDYQTLQLEYRPVPPDAPGHWPVVIVGAGPVGMTMALDLSRHGHQVLVLDDDHTLSIGSRAICFAKRTLDIWDRDRKSTRLNSSHVKI